MPAMPNFQADIARDWQAARDELRRHMHPSQHHLLGPHHDTPQPAHTPAAPQVAHNETQEEPMSMLDAIDARARAVIDEIANIDHQAIHTYEAIKATPEGGEILTILGRVATSEAAAILPPGAVATFLTILRGAEGLLATIPAPATGPQPAAMGPVVGGQA